MLWIVLGAGALIFYLLIGYPIALAVGRFRPAPPVKKDNDLRPTVSVIMAVYNGAAFLGRKLESILALDYPPELMQILLVSDGSTDDTESIAAEFASRGVRLIRRSHQGKAAAINAALAVARGDILFFTDVRQRLDSKALQCLVRNFADPTVGAVSGQLRLEPPESGEQAEMDRYWRYEVRVRHCHSRIGSLLGATGCIYAVRRRLAEPLRPGTLSDDVVIPTRAFLRGYRVVFEPEAVAVDFPAATGTEFRRRWRTLCGLLQAHAWYPGIVTASGRMRLHFLSHKLGRLVLPWAILTMAIASFGLPVSAFRDLLLSTEALALVLALLDLFVPSTSSLKRITSPARMFLWMNFAAAAAIAVFFLPAETLWRPTRVANTASPHSRPRTL